ncbi:MAG: DUF5123 domain-containing protein, partial [Anaerolineae bacterium]|nr:DUF5123 domain-containing protein [Anaerolineae bacterium]
MATRYMRAVHYRDCVFQDVYYACVNAYQGQIYDRCEFHGSGAPTALILAQASEGWVIARSCVFDGTGVSTTAIRVNAWCHGVIAENCTFYDFSGAAIDCETQLVVHNCIFKDCGYAFDVASPLTAAYVESDYNCFHGCTHIATVNGSDYTTLASWQALVDADSASPDANSLTDDPLLTDAANDDFSLMATSPCRYTGRGSGAVT